MLAIKSHFFITCANNCPFGAMTTFSVILSKGNTHFLEYGELDWAYRS